jgi:hypothetical protein
VPSKTALATSETSGAGGHGAGDHRLHHLGGGDHGTVEYPGSLDDVLLHAHQFGIANLDRQIAPGHHDGVGGLDDRVQGFDVVGQFRPFDLCHQAGVGAGILEQFAGHVHVVRGPNEGHRNIVRVQFGGGHYVLLVLFGQGVGGQATAALVQALVVGQRAADQHPGGDAVVVNGLHFHFNAAVVEYQDVARLDVPDQLFVVDTHALVGTRFLVHGGVQHEGLAGAQGDLVFGKAGNAQFRALEVGQQCNEAALGGGGLAHPSGASDVFFGAAVGEIQSGNVDSGADDGGEGLWRVGGGAEGGDNFGTPEHGWCPLVLW